MLPLYHGNKECSEYLTVRWSTCLSVGVLHRGRIPSSDGTVFIKGDQLEAGRGSEKK